MLEPTDEFNIYTREAGSGNLSVSIEGPSKADVQLKDLGHGYTICCYKVSKPGPTPSAQATCTCIIKCACCVPGEYGVHVKYDDEHVPDSPVMVYVAPEAGDAKLCTVHSIRDRGLDVRWVLLTKELLSCMLI